MSDLAALLEKSYPQSVRTAYLILGNRSDAEDAVQEAFLRAWKFRHSIAQESSVRAWLYRVVVNTCNSKLRRDIPRRLHSAEDHDLEVTANLEDASERFAVVNDITCALKDLPVHLRVVIVLRYFADLNEREIAIAIARKPGTVKSRLNEARRRLGEHAALRDHASHSFDDEVTG